MGYEDAEHPQTPLMKSSSSSSSSVSSSSLQPLDSSVKRTGTVWTAVAHIITGVIGAGVLSLAWTVAQLGWIMGPVTVLAFAAITGFAAHVLSDCYRSPDPECGSIINRSFVGAVKFYLGEKSKTICAVFLMDGLYGAGIAFTLTTASSVRAIHKSNCYHSSTNEAACEYDETPYMLMFGGLQILLSQIPDFHNMAWLSIVAATMSFSYAFTGMGLGLAKVIENGNIKGNIGGISTDPAVDKLWLSFQAIGDIAFAYPYTLIFFEIQNTLKSPPSENRTMKKASTYAIIITTFFYLCCGCFGYAAFGDATPGNFLAGVGFHEPYWLIDFANACVIVHLLGGYQVSSQPLFAYVEGWFIEKFPNSNFVNKTYALRPPFLPTFQLSPLRLCFRTVYVMSTTLVAVTFPYFNQVLGVLGALNFWPLAVYFPLEMYIVQRNIGAWTRKWVVYQTISVACLVVSLVALVGSIQGIVSAKLG